TYDADGFTLGHLETNNSGKLLPGSYTVTELVPAGWDLTRAECDDGFPSTDPSIEPIVLEAGEIVNCVFENTQRGTIAVAKETVPDADPATFDFTGDVAATLGDGQTSTPVEVIPGQYTSTETVPAGWDLTDISCDDNDSTGTAATATFNVQPGEDVVCTFTNTKRGMVELLKLTNGAENQTMVWNFTLTGPEVNESDSSPPTTVDFGGAKLIPGEEYTLCETGIPAGWTLEWSVDTTGDGTADTIIPMVSGVNNDPVDPNTGYSRVYDPNYVAPPGQYSNDTRCVNFVVDPGQTLDFQIDNQFPGGEPRTIGFWKNWNTCTGGNQTNTAAENGGPDEGWFILDDLLNDPGYTIGILQLDGNDCEDAVNILDKRSIDDGQKRASDGAYNLASQYLAAMVNLSAGAETCQAVVDAVNAAQTLLASIGFDGTGSYLQGAAAAEANALAATLDAYNNGELCDGGTPPPPPTLTPGGFGAPEGASGSTTVFEIPITLSAPSTETITVDYVAWPCGNGFPCGDGMATAPDDYELVNPGTLTFLPGETTKTVPVTVYGDDDPEPKVLWGEWFLIRFQNPSGAVLDTSFFGLGAGIIGEDDS
ncbi:MAG: hypothetical protein OES57_13205, partial [Acidimicrobiia bacterium]|nr:hypothetical protein [Acidimicrobiia bacterium]